MSSIKIKVDNNLVKHLDDIDQETIQILFNNTLREEIKKYIEKELKSEIKDFIKNNESEVRKVLKESLNPKQLILDTIKDEFENTTLKELQCMIKEKMWEDLY